MGGGLGRSEILLGSLPHELQAGEENLMRKSAVIYWFRNDLRLQDNPAFDLAYEAARHASAPLLAVYLHDLKHAQPTRWGFDRMGSHRQAFLKLRLQELREALQSLGHDLSELHGAPGDVLVEWARSQGAGKIFCEEIAAPEEQAEIKTLQAAGQRVQTLWQSSLLEPADLPFDVKQLPPVFTAFRNKVEQQGLKSRSLKASAANERNLPDTAATAHLRHYFSQDFASSYKLTRSQLMASAPAQLFSTRFSPWLACGALSAPMIYAALKRFEAERGANESTYWIVFELLWRDYFRFLHLQHGRQLYTVQGLASASPGQLRPPRKYNPQGLARWCAARTGEPLIDAGMAELAATGWLSNRMRQIVASYLIHDLKGDLRAGAAWFEAQLIDYDVYSNQGNWLYIAGRGTDPRGGRRFDPDKQARGHDPDGAYRSLWAQGI